jgi:pimeloyl-ACP methyl ester carboxylesterase
MASPAVEGYHCIGIDLEGFGQFGKQPGDYRLEGVAEHLDVMLTTIGIRSFYLGSHDRGAVAADFVAANHTDSVRGYARCEQHLYRYNPSLSRHLDLTREARYNHMLDNPKQILCMAYRGMSQGKYPVSSEQLRWSAQEFSYPGIDRVVVRYINSSTTEQKTKHRRNKQLSQWRCPVLSVIGAESPTQPREFFEGVESYIPNAACVRLKIVDGAGHFFPMERPEKATEEIRSMLMMCKEHDSK